MKERPVIMSAESVKAILEGRKTQTRRVVKPQVPKDGKPVVIYNGYPGVALSGVANHVIGCPYGAVGEHLWVREAHTRAFAPPQMQGAPQVKRGPALDDPSDPLHGWLHVAWADGQDDPGGWVSRRRHVSPLYMPRWASYLTLELTNVRVERLQEISHRDALAEGVAYDVSKPDGSPVARFQKRWQTLNAKRGYPWQSDPWVFVLEFKRASP